MDVKSVLWLRMTKTNAGVVTNELPGGQNHFEFAMGGKTDQFPRHGEFTAFFSGDPKEFADRGSGESIGFELETLGANDSRSVSFKRVGVTQGVASPEREGNWILSSQRPGEKQHPSLEPGGYFLPATRDEIEGRYFLILKDNHDKFHGWAGSRDELRSLSTNLSREIPEGDGRQWGVCDFGGPGIRISIEELQTNLGSAFSRETVESMSTVILERGDVSKPVGNARPVFRETSANVVERDARVVAWVRQEAKGICELCEQKGPFKKGGRDFLEVHHVIYLADGGHDTVNNAVAICPNCHRRCHLSDDAEEAKDELYQKVDRLDPDARADPGSASVG